MFITPSFLIDVACIHHDGLSIYFPLMGRFSVHTASLVTVYIGVLTCHRMASRVSCLLFYKLTFHPLLPGWEPVTPDFISIALDLAHQSLQSKGSPYWR
jgi:hypothetical protein